VSLSQAHRGSAGPTGHHRTQPNRAARGRVDPVAVNAAVRRVAVFLRVLGVLQRRDAVHEVWLAALFAFEELAVGRQERKSVRQSRKQEKGVALAIVATFLMRVCDKVREKVTCGLVLQGERLILSADPCVRTVA